METWNGRPILMPEVKTFSDLFEGYTHSADEAPPDIAVGEMKLTPYMHVHGDEPHRSFYVTVKEETRRKVAECCTQIPNDSLYFSVGTSENHQECLVLVQHNQIIGSRYLAVIDKASLPPALESRPYGRESATPIMRAEGFRISGAALDVLKKCTLAGDSVALPPGLLEAKLYKEVNEVLVRLGGAWSKSRKVHVFPAGSDAKRLVSEALETGKASATDPKNVYDYFPTPPEVVAQMLALAYIERAPRGGRFLEPSAGRGAIADALRIARPDCLIECYEIDPENKRHLVERGHWVVAEDFLGRTEGRPFSRVVMNPPFTAPGDNKAYIAHVLKAYSLLEDGGVLVSVVPGSLDGQDARTRSFRELVEARGHVEALPSRSFRDSGTDVNTSLVVLVRHD